MINHQSKVIFSQTNILSSLGFTSSGQNIEIMKDTGLLNMTSNKSDQYSYSLRKHPCNIQKIGCKNENFHWKKKCDIFLIFAQNIDCGYMLEPPQRGGCNEYPQCMFWAKIRKIGIPLHTPVLLYKSGV